VHGCVFPQDVRRRRPSARARVVEHQQQPAVDEDSNSESRGADVAVQNPRAEATAPLRWVGDRREIHPRAPSRKRHGLPRRSAGPVFPIRPRQSGSQAARLDLARETVSSIRPMKLAR
jgi:hypothetical protein